MTSEQSLESSIQIAARITEAILAKQLAPGTRLGEQQLADLFAVSRTLIREALMRLATRGIVVVSARRGWFASEAREAFKARRVIELGLLRHARPLSKDAIAQLRAPITREQAAIAGDDVGARSYLLGDIDEAERLMLDHLHVVESTLYEVIHNDPLNALRTALTPISAAKNEGNSKRRQT